MAYVRLSFIKFFAKGVGVHEDLEIIHDVLATEHEISLHVGGLARMRKTKTLPILVKRTTSALLK